MNEQSAQQFEQLERENGRLKRAVEELSILNDLARDIAGSLDSQEIIRSIVRRSLQAVNAKQGVITMVSHDETDAMKTLVRTMDSSAQQPQFHFNQMLLGWMQLNKKPLLLNDPRGDARFRGIAWEESIETLICVPLMVKSKLIGVLTVYNKRNGEEFSEGDQRLLAIIAGQSAQVVENARLYEEEKALIHMREELKFAAKIQADLLPKSKPEMAGYDIAGLTLPAQSVGGDYFDFIKIDDHRSAICLGDVSGKGLPASLLMANLQATIRGQALLDAPAKDCMYRANRLLHQSTDTEKFATFFFGRLDCRNHSFEYSNAGHNNPYLVSAAGEFRQLDVGGLILSIMDNMPYEQDTVIFEPGTCLVIYSDGVTEALNSWGEEFGEERLEQVIANSRDHSAAKLIDAVVTAVQEFTGDTPQSDDITLVVARRTA